MYMKNEYEYERELYSAYVHNNVRCGEFVLFDFFFCFAYAYSVVVAAGFLINIYQVGAPPCAECSLREGNPPSAVTAARRFARAEGKRTTAKLKSHNGKTIMCLTLW